MMSTLHTALACAAMLTGYGGDLPAFDWEQRQPLAEECWWSIRGNPDHFADQHTKGRERFVAEYGVDGFRCHAQTWILPAIDGRPPRFVVVMPADAMPQIAVTEGLRLINLWSDGQMDTADVYSLRERWHECRL